MGRTTYVDQIYSWANSATFDTASTFMGWSTGALMLEDSVITTIEAASVLSFAPADCHFTVGCSGGCINFWVTNVPAELYADCAFLNEGIINANLYDTEPIWACTFYKVLKAFFNTDKYDIILNAALATIPIMPALVKNRVFAYSTQGTVVFGKEVEFKKGISDPIGVSNGVDHVAYCVPFNVLPIIAGILVAPSLYDSFRMNILPTEAGKMGVGYLQMPVEDASYTEIEKLAEPTSTDIEPGNRVDKPCTKAADDMNYVFVLMQISKKPTK